MRFQKIVYLVIFALGMTGGFYLAMYMQNQTGILVGIAIIFAFLTWLGSGADLLGLLRAWYKQKKEEEKTPVLKFGGLFRNNEPAYYVRVQMDKGYGKAKSCEGRLFIKETEIQNVPAVWSDNDLRCCDIGGYLDLRLFRIEEECVERGNQKVEKSITFSLAKREQGYTEKRKRFDDFINKILTVKIYTARGNIPKPFTKRIADIIKEAILESSLNKSVMGTYHVANSD